MEVRAGLVVPKSSGALVVLRRKRWSPSVIPAKARTHTCRYVTMAVYHRLLSAGMHICRHVNRHRSVDAHTDAGTRRGEQTEASLHTHMASCSLGVARCGQSHMARPDDSWGRSEGCPLTGWPGKHCSSSRMDLNF